MEFVLLQRSILSNFTIRIQAAEIQGVPKVHSSYFDAL